MATPSPLNRGYSGGIAARGPVPVGRGAYDLNRAAQQTFRRTGNPAALMQMDWRNQIMANRQPQSGMPAAMPSAPALPAAPAPQGTWTPGYNGSQIYVPPPAPGGEMPAAMPAPPALAEPPAAPAPTPAQPQPQAAMMPFQFPPLPQNGLTLPPSTLGGSAGLPPQPMFQTQRVGGYDVLTGPDGKYYNSRVADVPQPAPAMEWGQVPGTNQFMLTQGGKRVADVPFHTRQPVPGSYVRRATQGQPTPMEYTPIDTKPATIKVIDREGKPLDFPAGYQLPPGYKELTPQGQPAPAASPAGSQTTSPGAAAVQAALAKMREKV